jgi:hypothetical protein
MNSFFQGSDNSAMGAINDPLNFVKNLWGGMHVPGMVTPTVSIDELDKKIQDLKTVESWLNVNMTMLKGTIQALEVQRATISTLQAMGESFAQQMHQAGAAEAKPEFKSDTKPDSKPDDKHVNASWPMPEAGSVKKPVAEAAAPAEPEAPKTADTAQAKQKADSAAGSQAEAMSPFANTANLWGMLQDQFKQAVSKAMATESIPANGKPATASASKNTPAKSAAEAKPVKTPAKTAAKAQPKELAKAVGKAPPKVSAKAGTTTRAKAPLKKTAAPKAAKP